MIITKFSTLVIILFIGCFNTFGQSKISKETAIKYANEVYGDTKVYQSNSHIIEYMKYLNRVSVVKEFDKKIKDIKLLSSVRLKNKYANITYDNYTNFNPKNFNALKYAFNFESNTDQVFQVNGTKFYILLKAKN